MKQIHDVVLELVRPGPAHNQLISPLTSYVALCGGDSPVSVHLPFEQQQLMIRIQRLRYELETGTASGAQIAQRQAELHEMGKILGDVLGEIPAFLAELSRIRCEGGKLVHLRLSLSASELGMVPFETAISPAGFPGSGSPLFLQSHTPVTVTREIRRGRMLPLAWNQPPKILFAFASPPGMASVPAEEHLKAIRDAIAPWVKIKEDPQDKLKEIKKLLTVLPDASLQQIRDHCSQENYTHIHILAHGAAFKNAGDNRYGVALCRENDKSLWEVVDGESLAIALTGKSASGTIQFIPTVVSLATCDSGNIESVITPGGSIAHELHNAGIPWVVASQFPLWMSASTLAVRELFRGLLAGEDPRWVLYSLRRRLRTDCPNTHDWASIVAYATLTADFEHQIEQFRDRQMRSKLAVQLNRLDDLFAVNRLNDQQPPTAAAIDELCSLSVNMRDTLARWRSERPVDNQLRLNPAAAYPLGMSGACEKRLGIACWVVNRSRSEDHRYLDAYQASRNYYHQAIEADSSSNWPITQYLAMNAIIDTKTTHARTPFGIPPKDWWYIAIRLGESERETPRAAYALTDLVELSLLGCVYDPDNKDALQKQIGKYIDELLRLEDHDRTPITALLRQLWRYRDFWRNPLWDTLVIEAIAALSPETQN